MRTEIMALLSSTLGPLGYPIGWPGVNFTPPGSGYWLEVTLFENSPLQPYLGNDDGPLLQGMIQVLACTRPGSGLVGVSGVADQVVAALPKGTRINSAAKINRHPYRMADDVEDARVVIPVTAEYGP